MNNRKRAMSIRMSASDIASVKRLAKRLGARDSDVIRCAVKMMMAKLGPLADGAVRGRKLVPVLVESGGELFRHFDLDAVRLENIVNDGVQDDAVVDHEDIQLLAMSGVQRSFVKIRLNALTSNGHGGSHAQDPDQDRSDDNLDESLRQYLFDKYVYRAAVQGGKAQSNGAERTMVANTGTAQLRVKA